MTTILDLVRQIPALRLVGDHERQSAHLLQVNKVSRAQNLLDIWPRGSEAAGHLVVTLLDAAHWDTARQCNQVIRALVRAQATALLIAPAAENRSNVRTIFMISEAARRMRLPLILVDTNEPSSHDVVTSVERIITIETLGRELRYMHSLVSPLRKITGESVELEFILDATSRAMDGHAAMVAPDGTVIGSANIIPVLARIADSPNMSRVQRGEADGISVNQDGFMIRLVAVGNRPPRPVLAVARRAPFSERVVGLINHAASILSVRDQLSRVSDRERELAETLRQSRIALFTNMLNGEVETSKKVKLSGGPDFLDFQHAQVFVVHCPSGQRSKILDGLEEALSTKALIVGSPIRETELAVVAPSDKGSENRAIQQLLVRITANQGCSMGQSRPVRFERLRDAYDMAVQAQALAMARHLPNRSVMHADEWKLAQIMDPRAVLWARSFLKPPDEPDFLDRDDVKVTVRQALQFGHSHTARLLGINRKTVAARCRDAGTALGLDLHEIQDRALLDLALQLVENPWQGLAAHPVPSLEQVLASEAARNWSIALLRPLQKGGRPMLGTVKSWLASNGDIARCSQDSNVHPNTVRNHLSSCERALGRRLVGTAGGAYDIAFALEISGDPSVRLAARAQECMLRRGQLEIS